MKKYLKRSLLALLVLLLALIPVLATTVSAAEYAETAEWLNTNPNAPTDYAFSIAVVGDTQILTEVDTNSRADDDPSNDTNYIASIYNWIVANAEAKKMQYVLGLGDITQYDADEEWVVAKDAITKMNGVVPYTLVKGAPPHDSAAQFNKYFAGEEAFTSTIDGYYEAGSVLNTYSTFVFGEVKYLILALDFAAPDPVLEWAGSVISSDEYKDHKVIITTHSYLWKDGTPVDQNAPTTALPDKPEYTSDDKYNNGDELWDKFVSKYENICLILCGHFTHNDIVASQKVGDHGNIVTQMMINPQSFDNNNDCETGMVAMLYFSADGNDVSVEYYSTYRNQYYRDTNQFDFKMDELTLNVGALTEYGLIPQRSYDPDNYPYALFKKTPSYYEGVKYEYTFVGAYKTLMGNESLGASASDTVAYHVARMSVGDGAVILMLRDVNNTDDYPYSNLQYHPGNLTLDLGGHTMTDSHTYSTGLFYMHIKTSDNPMKLTVKNGNMVIGDGDLVSYGANSGKTNLTAAITFDGVNFSWREGSTATHFVRKYASTYKDVIPVVFDGCTFDMTNASSGFRFSQVDHAGSVTVKNSKIINSKYAYNVNEYGYAKTKPTELEHIAVYQDIPSSVTVDGATFVSNYTFHGYYKALYANAALGITTTTSAYHAVRSITENKNVGGTLVLLTNHEITSSADYSNLCYNVKDATFDLRGYTLTDSNTHNATMFNLNIKAATSASSKFTVKNGNIVLGTDDLCNYTIGNQNYGVHLAFENVNFSWKESGATASAFIGTTTAREKNPISFTNCVIDLKNAKSGIKLEAGGTLNGVNFNNTVILNSTDAGVYTESEADALDGNYIITEYGILPLSIHRQVDIYPFVGYQKKSVTINGISYAYTYYGAYKVFTGDTAIGVTADKSLGADVLRYAGDGGVLLMRRDFTDTADKNYTNLCYGKGNVTFDLGGYTYTDMHTHNTALFHSHLKYANQNVTITVKNGSIVLNKKALTSYDIWDAAIGSSSIHMVFEDLHISFAKGSTLTSIIGKFTKNPDLYSVSFVNTVIDLENAPAGFELMAQKSGVDSLPVTLTNTDIINSSVILPKNSITLQNDFVLNVYIPTTAANAAVKITSADLGGAKYSLTNLDVVNIDGASYYKLCFNVSPENAADVWELSVAVDYTYTYSDGSTKVTSTTLDWEVSILKYLETVVNGTDTAATQLAKDILAYIRSVYVYCNNSEKLDEVKLFVDGINGADYDANNLPTFGEAVKTVDAMSSAKLLLGGAPAFVFYPETDADGNPVYPLESYVFALDGKYKLSAEITTDESGKTVFVVTVPAYAFDNTIEYIVVGTDIHGAYNLQAYYDHIKDGNNYNLISLVERVMKYAESAEAYKNTRN